MCSSDLRTENTVATVLDEVDYVFDAVGELLAEYAVVGNSITPAGVQYVTADWLGSTRLVTDGVGAVVSTRD